MVGERVPSIGIVHARQDDDVVARLIEALESEGVRVHRRRIMGLPGKPFVDGDDRTPASPVTLVVWTPWLRCSDWAFSKEAQHILDEPEGQVILVQVTDAAGRLLCTNYASSPLGRCETLAPLKPDHAGVPGLARTLARRAAGKHPKRARRPDPGAPLVGASPLEVQLSERLDGLYALAGLDPAPRGLVPPIDRTLAAWPDPSGPRPGSFLAEGRFRLLELRTTGPLVGTWRAWDREHRQLVAVRILHPHWVGDPRRELRFQRTVSVLQALEHPGVVGVVHSQATDPEQAWFATDWCDGGSLGELLEAERVDVLGMVQGVFDVARTLVDLHAQGVMHGNLKPSNVLLDGAGRGVLTDLHGDAFEVGDPLFAAPELQESPDDIAPTADVYSLTMCVLAALHGRPLPFWVLRDPARLIESLQLPGDRGPLAVPTRAALMAGLEWRIESRTASVDAWLRTLSADAALMGLLRSHAESAGRPEAAAHHLGALLELTEERPVELVLTLGRTWANAGPRGAGAARPLLFEAAERCHDLETLAEAVDALRGLATTDDLAAALADRLDDLRDEPEFRVACLVHAARIRDEQVGDPGLAAATWNEVLELHLHRRQAVEAYRRLVAVARIDTDASSFFELGTQAFPFLPRDEQGELAYELGVIAQELLENAPDGLRWLELAQELGHTASDIQQRLEALRSARGEWRQVVSLMLERAEAIEDEAESVALLVRAARVAVHAHNQHDDAATILMRVLLKVPEHRHALRFLARYHARAGRDERALALYARLAPHEARVREGEPLAVRVADNVDYAHVLLRNDRPRGAQLCLEAALDLMPTHVPTLQLTSELAYDLGKWEEARVANEGLVTTFGSATNEPLLLASRIRLGDIAWLHGDLLGAIEHYDAALELDPADARVWWGKAKVALAGIHGRLDATHRAEEPWLLAAPVRYTAEEALARLLSALIRPEALEGWLELDPMGRELAGLLSSQHPTIRACAVVDLMVLRGLVGTALFNRLGRAHPGWAEPIEAVRRLWLSDQGARGFDVAASYGWEELPGADFDPTHHRTVIAGRNNDDSPIRSTLASLASLGAESAWKRLLLNADQVRRSPPGIQEVGALAKHHAVGILEVFPDLPERRTLRVEGRVVVGSGVQDDLSVVAPGLEPGHATLERVGDTFYIQSRNRLRVDGVDVQEIRLRGGESIRMGAADAVFQVVIASADGSWVVERPLLEEKPASDDLVERVERAALFYREGGSDRIVPLATDRLVLWEDDAGELRTRPGSHAAHEIGLTLDHGGYWLHEPGAEPRNLQHRDEIVVGHRLLQFKELNRGLRAPLADIAALWGAPEGPILVYDDGSKHGRPIVLDRPTYRIGRGRQADFQISFDTSLSRVHCIFFVRGDEVTVRDAGSANGTEVNGVTIEGERILATGDLVVIGQSRFHFRATPVGEAGVPDELEDFGTEENTEVLGVSERIRQPLGLDEGLEKIRVANRALRAVLTALDSYTGDDTRGQRVLETMVAARPRSYQNLLEDVDVRGNALPGLEVMFNVAQRPDAEQRPLLNHVLRDVVERAIETLCVELPDDQLEPVLIEVAETRYREMLRI